VASWNKVIAGRLVTRSKGPTPAPLSSGERGESVRAPGKVRDRSALCQGPGVWWSKRLLVGPQSAMASHALGWGPPRECALTTSVPADRTASSSGRGTVARTRAATGGGRRSLKVPSCSGLGEQLAKTAGITAGA
jgi:hypothetical protein